MEIRLGKIRLFWFLPANVAEMFSLPSIEDGTTEVVQLGFLGGKAGGIQLVILRRGSLDFEGANCGFFSTAVFWAACFRNDDAED